MILIDFVYINSPGGLSLSKLLLDYIIERKIKSKIEVLVDKRNYKYFKNYKINLILISKSEFSRFNFYKKNKKRFESLLCFANVPPPLKIQVKTLIYFHNEILLNSNNLNFSLIKKIFFKLKWLYIKSQNSNYTWIVQTNHMKDLLGDKLKVNSNNILKYPIFKNQKIYTESKQNNTYIYPTSNEPHKNNHRVLNAFISAARKTDQKITLTLTIKKINIKLPQNLKVNFLGLIKSGGEWLKHGKWIFHDEEESWEKEEKKYEWGNEVVID